MPRWLFGLVGLACCVSPGLADWALVNLIRHGERYADKGITSLAPDGADRADYLARCVTGQWPSLAFPRGPPSVLLAGRRQRRTGHNSTRLWETLQPLARKSGTHLDNHVDFVDVEGFVSYVQGLPPKTTALVAWEHKLIGKLARALDPHGLAPAHYPDQCELEGWSEPAYTKGACYDVIWQLVLYRAEPAERWRAKGFAHLHMGFAGRGSPCAEALEPYSNPTSWEAYPNPKDSGKPVGARGASGLGVPGVLGLCSMLLLLAGRFGSSAGFSCLVWKQRGQAKEPLLGDPLPDDSCVAIF